MASKNAWSEEGQRTYTIDEPAEQKTIEQLDLVELETKPILKFVVAFAIGFFFFLVPVTWNGQVTVPFDIAVSYITDNFPGAAGIYAFLLIVAGGILTTASELRRRDVFSVGEGTASRLALDYWETSLAFWLLRVLGAVLAPIMLLQIGPDWLHAPGVGGLVWGTLIISVAVIIPIGAIFINLFVELGGLEFVGTLARPIMKPLFKIPGRAALDSVASWVGSYSVGLYVTRNVFDRGEYSKREVYVISTCFATVSIGFVGVVAATLELLDLFPIIFLSYLVCIAVTAAILVRIPPLSRVPDEYISEPNPEEAFTGSLTDYVRYALSEAVGKAKEGNSLVMAGVRGFIDGLKLAMLILGTILAVGLAALLVATYTDVFDILAQPLIPVISLLGIPDAATVAPATIIGIAEMYIPALLVVETAVEARFFIAVLSISQLIFFSSVGPMMMDMFNDVPIRFRDLVALFVMRTIILIPLIAGLTHLLSAMGML